MSSRFSRLVAAVALVGAVAAASLAPVHAAHPKAVKTLIFWQWVTGADKATALWNKSHPDVQVIMRNVGSGTTEYTKLTTAINAKTGAPDLAQVEFQYVPQFESTGGLVDMGKYGANSVKSQFVPWTWAQVSSGSSVYAIPQDSGPEGLYYNASIFAKYHVAVPTTWAQYMTAAEKLHAANKNLYISNFDVADGGWFTGLVWQAGNRPFTYNASSGAWTVHVADAAALKVANFWQQMIDKGLVKLEGDFSQDVYADWAKGNVATRVSAVWDANTIATNAPKTTGQWRVAPEPQWGGGPFVTGNWGGSTTVVTTQSKDPADAVAFAEFLNTQTAPYQLMITGNNLWPTTTKLLDLPNLYSANKFFGGQSINNVFRQSSKSVDVHFLWGPVTGYVYSQMGNNFLAASQHKMTLAAALQKTQQQVVTFMKQQGYMVQ